MPPRKTKVAVPLTLDRDYEITVVGRDTVRLDVYSGITTPHYIAHVWSAEETMEFARKLTSAALQAGGSQRKK